MYSLFFKYDSVKNLLDTLPIFRLFRKDSAALIISFLHDVFKVEHISPIKNHELVKKLAMFLEEHQLGESTNMEKNLLTAKKYIENWCNDEILRQYPNEQGENLHELTSYSERALQWIRSLKPQEFIGTESRFRDILRRLNELMEETTEDPIQKISELEQRRTEFNQKIDAEIRQIQISGKVNVYSHIALKERYEHLTEDAKSLVSDFKEVEANFRKIAQDIYQKQLGQVKKGQILGDLLAETERLEVSSQGISFYSFWEYLRVEDAQQNIYKLTRDVYKMLEQRGVATSDKYLLHLKLYLFEQGRKVLDSNNALMEKLSRTMSEKRLKHRVKALELTSEIQKLAIQLAQEPPSDADFFYIELPPKVELPLDRPLQLEEAITERAFQQPKDTKESLPQGTLFEDFEIDSQQIVKNIRTMLKKQPVASLSEILEMFPLEKGVAELLMYYTVAPQFQYSICTDEIEIIPLRNAKCQIIETPKLIFNGKR